MDTPTRQHRPDTTPPRRAARPALLTLALVLGLVAALAPATTAVGAPADDVAVYGPKVYNGTQASIADLPYVVYVETAVGSCTGSVIAPDWILTAAHCFSTSDPSGVVIGIGSDSLTAGFPELTPASQVIIHPGYNPTTNVADLALVRLSSPTSAAPIALVAAGTADPVGSRATITGWGRLITLPQPQYTEVLMRADIPVLDDSACSYYGGSYDPATMVCAGGEGRDVCGGDSGGPLILGSGGSAQQVGLVSFGEPCGAQSSTIGAYTAVAPYRSWIDGHLGSASLDPTGFSDVPSTHPHAESIALVAAAGIAGGYTDGTYRPSEPVTRAQMATFLMRAIDASPGSLPTPFWDVPSSNIHAGAIAAVVRDEIAGGFTDGSYRPSQAVTRGQMATFIMRAANVPAATGAMPFQDVPADYAHAAAIAAVAQAGIAAGVDQATYAPSAAVTRGQMAAFIARAFLGAQLPTPPGSPSDPGPIAPPPDGSDPGALYNACTAGDWQACDDLWEISAEGSFDQAFADTCGNRIPAGNELSCQEAFTDPRVLPCIEGDMVVCDQLYQASPAESWEDYVADTCGFRRPTATALRCTDVFGDVADDGGEGGGGSLRDACAAGDWQACDELFLGSPSGSADAAFGDTCGERIPANTGLWCTVAFADGRVEVCIAGNMAVCDDLYLVSPVDSWEEHVGDTCGFRRPMGADTRCVDAFG